METNNFIYSVKKDYLDIFHLKCSEIPVNKEDYISSEDFSNLINEPFEIYEKYLRAIELEKRIAVIHVETPTEKFPIPVDEETFLEIEPDIMYKVFVGEYDGFMKEQIEDYIHEHGFQNKRREESRREYVPGYRHVPYNCNILDTEHTLGFYFTREGLLRNCFNNNPSSDHLREQIGGNITDFKNIEQYLDKELIIYLYGLQGWKNLTRYYNEHFLENFEYGKSILYAPDI